MLNETTPAIPEANQEITDFSLSIYWIRLIIAIFAIILPLIILFSLYIRTFLIKERYYFKTKVGSFFLRYNYAIHSILFVITVALMLFFISIIIASLINFYNGEWFTDDSKIFVFVKDYKRAFLALVLFGLFLNVISCWIYLYYNLKKTKNFFAYFLNPKIIKIIAKYKPLISNKLKKSL